MDFVMLEKNSLTIYQLLQDIFMDYKIYCTRKKK